MTLSRGDSVLPRCARAKVFIGLWFGVSHLPSPDLLPLRRLDHGLNDLPAYAHRRWRPTRVSCLGDGSLRGHPRSIGCEAFGLLEQGRWSAHLLFLRFLRPPNHPIVVGVPMRMFHVKQRTAAHFVHDGRPEPANAHPLFHVKRGHPEGFAIQSRQGNFCEENVRVSRPDWVSKAALKVAALNSFRGHDRRMSSRRPWVHGLL
jgi:hypothetical protein